MNKNQCPCCSGKSFAECCALFINSNQPADTAEQLMRSRYTAFTQSNLPYLVETTHPSTRIVPDIIESVEYLRYVQWQGLKIVKTKKGKSADLTGIVEFVASYLKNGKAENIHEKSDFVKESGKWYYLKGKHY